MRAWSVHARSQVMVDNGADRLRKRTGPGGPPGLQNRSLPASAGGLGSTPRRFRQSFTSIRTPIYHQFRRDLIQGPQVSQGGLRGYVNDG